MRNLEEYYYETLLQLHVVKANDNSTYTNLFYCHSDNAEEFFAPFNFG